MADKPSYGLCWRCEHRARFHETGHAPRCECGDGGAICCCYMYKPVSPCATKRAPGDKRSRFAGAMLTAREVYAGVAEVTYHLAKGRGGDAVSAVATGKIVKDSVPARV